jgi:hypothetical protein
MAVENLALVRGLDDTRATLARWSRDPWPPCAAGSPARWPSPSPSWRRGGIASLSTPDATPIVLPGLNAPADLAAVAEVLRRNALVLALHGFACVAGFIAGSSLPQEAERYSGALRRIHDLAGPLAIAFVGVATAFSLITQAYVLGGAASTLAAQGAMHPVLLLVGLLPHALPELVALFLPLAAWMIASRRGTWHELLAATVATCGLAVPVLVVAAFVEVYVSPDVILALRG